MVNVIGPPVMRYTGGLPLVLLPLPHKIRAIGNHMGKSQRGDPREVFLGNRFPTGPQLRNGAGHLDSRIELAAGDTSVGFGPNSASSVSGGALNTASGGISSVSGGSVNTASGNIASVSGGENNTAGGNFSSVSGGSNRTAPGTENWAAGPLFATN